MVTSVQESWKNIPLQQASTLAPSGSSRVNLVFPFPPGFPSWLVHFPYGIFEVNVGMGRAHAVTQLSVNPGEKNLGARHAYGIQRPRLFGVPV